MLQLHDRILFGDQQLVVIGVRPGAFILIDRGDPRSWPQVWSVDDASEHVVSGAWKVEQGEPYAVRLDSEISDAQRVKRDADWAIIKDHVNDPGVFDDRMRAALIKDIAAANALSEPTVRKLLRRYFQRGLTASALVADWDRCGASGVEREPGDAKRGAPRKSRALVLAGILDGEPPPPGVNVTVEDRRLFALAIAQSYRKDARHHLPSAYRLCIARYLSVEDPASETGRSYLERFRKDGPPTLRQFVYWSKKDGNWEDVLEQRLTPRVYQMKRRPLLGTAEAYGPGSRFELDATILDVWVRSRRDRRFLVGRPVLYLIIDAFSRMIVGFSLSFEHASWHAAMTALATCVQDKVALCARHGVKIEPWQWPVRHMPAALLGDNGEVKGRGVSQLLTSFGGLDVQNAPAYRGDWKSLVERRFGLIQTTMAPYTPGYVRPDFRERGAPDYRTEAVLDLDDVMVNLIEIIRYFNTKHLLVDFPRYVGQVEDGILSVPLDLWNWGIANRTGSLREPDPERFRFALLPRATAVVRKEGIYFEGRYYLSDVAERRGMMTKARDGRFEVAISYDKRDADCIYVHDKGSPKGFFVATLTRRSEEYRGLNSWEVFGLQAKYAAMAAEHRPGQDLAHAAMEKSLEVRGRGARKAFAELADPDRVGRDFEDLRQRRAIETAGDRIGDVARFRPGAASSELQLEKGVEGAAVLPFVRRDERGTDSGAAFSLDDLADPEDVP